MDRLSSVFALARRTRAVVQRVHCRAAAMRDRTLNEHVNSGSHLADGNAEDGHCRDCLIGKVMLNRIIRQSKTDKQLAE